MEQHLHSKNAHRWLPLSLRRHSCTGRKQGAGKRKDIRKRGKEWQEKKKKKHKTGTR